MPMNSMDQNNMNSDIQHWTFLSVITGLFNAIYNMFNGLSFHDWIAVAGVLGMLFSLLMQRFYNRRKDRREAEKHEWERQRHEATLQQLKEQ